MLGFSKINQKSEENGSENGIQHKADFKRCRITSRLRFGFQKPSQNSLIIDPECEKTRSKTDVKNDDEF